MSETIAIPIPLDAIERFRKRFAVERFALFGSVLRDDFGPTATWT